MPMTSEVLLLLAAGVGLAFTNTLASSGSALSLPVLLSLGLLPEVANGTNRIAVLAGALAATLAFVRAGRVPWRVVRLLGGAAAAGAISGALISEVISPTALHLAIVAALLVALGLLAVKPSRWLDKSGGEPVVGPVQMLLIFLVGVWAGFIVLDGMTYLLLVLVLSVGLDVSTANVVKTVLAALMAAVSSAVLIAGGDIDWAAAAPLSIGAVVGGLCAARLALHPAAARWIYRLLVLVIAGEVLQLLLARPRV